MNDRRSVVKALAQRYGRAGKKQKGQLLDEVVALTGYSRWYAVGLLRGQGKAIQLSPRVRLVGDLACSPKRVRARRYDAPVVRELKRIWVIMDGICGKRLVAVLPELIGVLEKHHEIALESCVREKLLSISAASIDRLLAPERARLAARARSGTKPGTLLKHQIPIRTFAEWDQAKPGFVEIDLVGHDGGVAQGEYCQTLDLTDVASGWTETEAVINKAQVWVFEALQRIRARLPFALRGIDSDNGSEFINHHLLRYCQQEKITFTRGRAGKKNDGCYVEQKNYSVVRRAAGYARYDSPAQLRLLNELYRSLRLYTNYFQPVMKLVKKERTGAKVKKRYDRAQTPYQRLLASGALSEAARQLMQTEYAQLNPAELKRTLNRLQAKLLRSARPVEATTVSRRAHAAPARRAQAPLASPPPQ
jgi:hypothetical protein